MRVPASNGFAFVAVTAAKRLCDVDDYNVRRGGEGNINAGSGRGWRRLFRRRWVDGRRGKREKLLPGGKRAEKVGNRVQDFLP